jgi:hypothetical protein
MNKNQWLSSAETNGLNQDDTLYKEQEQLANELNSL